MTSARPRAMARSLPRDIALGLAVALALLLALPAAAAETINSFTSNLTVLRDGSVAVTEILDVNAEGHEIRRGIFRDIPTLLVNDDGSRLRSGLDIVAVERNGRPEPFAIESLGGGFVRIRIGDADVFLDRGVHRYTIQYTMTRMARRFADHDEIYWNATGNYWNFPILGAVATVTLPEGAVIGDVVGYTGPVGSTEQAVTVTRRHEGSAIVRANRVLQPGEGMSFAAALPKGVLADPDDTRRVADWLSDHRDLVYPLLAVALVVLYNLLAWHRVGRDPRKGVIIPLFHPPRGYSPALVHYVHRMGWDRNGWTAFTAAIFDLGVKGLVLIDNAGEKLKLSVTGKEPDEPLPPGERIVFKFLKSRGTVVVDTANGAALNTRRDEFVRTLEKENRLVYFRNNTGYVVGGGLLSALCLLGLVLLDVLSPLFLVLAIVVGIGLGMLFALGRGLLQGNWGSRLTTLIALAVVMVNFGGMSFAFLDDFEINTGLLAAGSIVLLNVVFAVLMRAPTIQGRKRMDDIDGFKMYLQTAEEKRLNYQSPPMTVERFEAILPYAIALKVEKQWSSHFEAELERHAVKDYDAATYRPRWYAGSDWSSARGGFSNAVAAVTGGMAAAMISAQPASASSSGFSGGFSGGGGGGGGGGGW